MTEIEEKFYKTFDIKPKWKDKRVKYAKTYYTEEQAKYLRRTTKNRNIQLVYPQITSDILLKLIYIMANGKYGNRHFELFTAFNDEWFAVLKDKYNVALCAGIDITPKNAILKLCIYRSDIEEFKNEVKSLFEEGAEDDRN